MSIGSQAFYELEDLIINNEHFIKRSDGVVMSCNPSGIVFVPSQLIKLKVDYGVEFIQSFLFHAFDNSELISITFEIQKN